MKRERVPIAVTSIKREFHQIEDFRRIELTDYDDGKKICQGIAGIDSMKDLGKIKTVGVKNARYKNATKIRLKSGGMYTVTEKYAYIKKIMDEGPLFILRSGEEK